MIHVRAVSPVDVTEDLVSALADNPGVLNLIVLVGAARNPIGDAVHFDVIAAEANGVLQLLRGRGLDRRGSIIIENVDASISDLAARAEGREPALASLAPFWEEAEARIRAGETYPPSWFALLTIAGLIGAVGILTNSQVLIVGAMVVGPEYGAIVSVALAINERRGKPIRSGLSALAGGFALVILATLAFSLAIRAFDLQSVAFTLGVRPVSDLINSPDAFSVIVAALAGFVGVISLTEARTSTLVGVFISVTTIPAASAIGVSSAFGSWSEAWGSLVQLLLNVAILTAVGAVGLVMQRKVWQRVGRRPLPSHRDG
jgi:uncharacterized hydrophobic protein (TIGR00271 family)